MPHPISVSVRLRPLQQGSEDARISVDRHRGIVTLQKTYEAVENVVTGSDQTQAYDAIAGPLLKRLRDGYSCTLLAYGQTGSGKTHTMLGPPGSLTEASLAATTDDAPASWGIFPRIALELLQNESCTLHASAIEVYQDAAYDLLDDRAPLQVGTKSIGRQVGGGGCVIPGLEGGKAGASGGAHAGVHPPHCQCRKCFEAQEAEKEARAAKRNSLDRSTPGDSYVRRGIASAVASGITGTMGAGASSSSSDAFATIGEKLMAITNPVEVAQLARTIELTRTSTGHALNARSSRSHCLVHLYCVEKSKSEGGNKKAVTTKKQLLFVDLAGSERILKSKVTGVAATQAMAINSNLTALGKVIRALGNNAKHVPYRDSMLTMLLRSSLEGQATTAVVVNVASEAEHYEETICSLDFGERMAGVKTTVTKVVGQSAVTEEEITALREELSGLQREIVEMEAADLDVGDFHPEAVPSEVRSCKLNFRKHRAMVGKLKDLRMRRAEDKDASVDEKVPKLQNETSKQLDLLETQKTAPAFRGGPSIWMGPNKMYVSKVARKQAIEEMLLGMG